MGDSRRDAILAALEDELDIVRLIPEAAYELPIVRVLVTAGDARGAVEKIAEAQGWPVENVHRLAEKYGISREAIDSSADLMELMRLPTVATGARGSL